MRSEVDPKDLLRHSGSGSGPTLSCATGLLRTDRSLRRLSDEGQGVEDLEVSLKAASHLLLLVNTKS